MLVVIERRLSMDNFRRNLLNKEKIDTGRITIDGYEAVDLGLPSGLLWATRDVLARFEGQYGYHFMFGTGSETYNETYSRSGSYTEGYYDGREEILPYSKDTARQIMGGSWRMPTKNECQELVDNTDCTVEKVNGYRGAKFTSKTDSNKYVFFPFAGYYYDGSLDHKTQWSLLWTSTLEPYTDSAYSLNIMDLDIYIQLNNCCYGLSVRGVHDPI